MVENTRDKLKTNVGSSVIRNETAVYVRLLRKTVDNKYFFSATY